MSGEGILDTVKDAAEVISEKIAEVGSGIGMGEEGNDKPFKMPTRDELLAMLDTMGLGDEEKEELRAALLSGDPMGGPGLPGAQPWTTQALILMSFLFLVASVFVFIGYRLYKSMNDRELKKEEKRQKKQMKKDEKRKRR